MPPNIPIARATLSYPLYAADFDPEDERYLIVGGGGGEGRTGVGNRITVLGHESSKHLAQLGEIELSRDEDSVTSLAFLRRISPLTGIALAGINSSVAAQAANQNEHLRAFRIAYQQERAGADEKSPAGQQEQTTPQTKADVRPISRRSLFGSSADRGKETYQRILRLSPALETGVQTRLAALATGLAPEGEIVLVSATSGSLADPVVGRIQLGKDQEAADVDIRSSGEGRHEVAYCTDHEVSVCSVTDEPATKGSAALDPRDIFKTPNASPSTKGRTKFRALRFLGQRLILLLANLPGRTGTEVLVLRYSESAGEILLRRRLHASMKAGVGLEVSSLGVRDDQTQQFVVAVAGQDTSIELLTLDCNLTSKACSFQHYATFRDVHPLQMTKIALSSHFLRRQTETARYVRLVSVSMGNTVVVHSLPLVAHAAASKQPYYTLQRPARRAAYTVPVVVLIFALILGLLFRSYPSMLEIGRHRGIGDTKPGVQLTDYDSKEAVPPRRLSQLFQAGRDVSGSESRPLLVHDKAGEISTEVHEDEEAAGQAGRRWDELKDGEKEHWRRRLVEAGEWAAEEGETILKGVFFGEIAGQVAQAVGGGG